MAKAARFAERGNDVHLNMLRFNIGLHVNEEVYKDRASGRWHHARLPRLQKDDAKK
ncbi:MAG: hypothetical protein WBC78_09170 [Candidatus Sulfotelmatobacter sp.]